MNSIRSKWVHSVGLNNSLCDCRLLNCWYLPEIFPSPSPCSRIFASYIWLLISFDYSIHFILRVIEISDRLSRLSIFFNLGWRLLVEEFRLTILVKLIFLALSGHKVLMKLLILNWLKIVFLNVLHNNLISIFYVSFIVQIDEITSNFLLTQLLVFTKL